MGACAEAIKEADWMHLDIMDGHFVPNISFGPDVVRALRPVSDLFFDVHLMLSHPKFYIEKFAQAGAELITFHVECEDDIAETIAEIKKYNIKVGLSLKPGTPVEALYPYIDDIDLVLVMTVEPGFGGQKFMEDMMPKVKQLREWMDDINPDCLIEVDGGVDATTCAVCKENGAEVLVAGSAYFKAADRAAFVKIIQA
jgi:ribulose-phosphate 3-epimerase